MAVDRQYFTLAEANAQVPRLQAIFAGIMRVRAQLKALYQRLDAQKLAPVGEDFEPEVPGAPPEAVRERAVFKGLIEVLRGELIEVEELGCVVKDLETGLCDWFSRSGGRDVFLCWRFGEKEVGFWHDLETGFAGRRPVSELAPADDERTLH